MAAHPRNRFDRRRIGVIAVLALAATFWFAVARGQDVNWDQQNYHLAVPFLLLHGGFWESVAPTGSQSFFNPLALIPPYLAIRHLPPVAAALAIAAVQALAFVIGGLICLALEPAGVRRLHSPAMLGFLLCLASPMALSEAGSTFIDLATSIPILLAVLLLLLRPDARRPMRICVAAGLLLGVAGGLKLTNLLFLFAVPGLLTIGRERLTRRAALFAAVCLAAGVGFVAVAGWWNIQVWQHFANPLFPFFNAVFRSPDYPAVNIDDDRFIGRTPWDLLRYPIDWLFGGGGSSPALGSPSSEVAFRDARFILILPALALLAAAAATRPALRRRVAGQPATALLLAWITVYVVWLYAFGIHRYALALEILCGPALLALSQSWPWRVSPRGPLTVALVACLALIHVPSWRRFPFGPQWRGIMATPTALPGHPLIFVVDAPIAVAALSISDNARYVGIASIDLAPGVDTTLVRQIKARLADTANTQPYALARQAHDLAADPQLRAYRIGPAGPCRMMATAVDALKLCPLARLPAPP